MVAYAMHHCAHRPPGTFRAHPGGEHGRQFDFAGWLFRAGFAKVSSVGTTAYGGDYGNEAGQTITVNPKASIRRCCHGGRQPDHLG